VLVISTQNFPPEIGGIGNLMYDLCQSLSAHEEQIVVFADHKKGFDIKNFDRAQAYRIYRSSGLKPLRRRLKARAIHRLVKYNTALKSNLIADSWKSLEHIQTKMFSRVVCLVHGTEIPPSKSGKKAGRIKASLSKADFIIANSNYTADIVSPFIDDEAKLRTIHPGIMVPQRDREMERQVATRLASNSPILITVARLEMRKGQQQVLKIMPELLMHYPELLYVIVGTGTEKDLLQETISQLGISKHVLFTGSLTGTEKNAYLANCDLHIMPGSIVGQDVEGFGMAYIEAGYFSVPSIASRAGGAPEAVLHNKTGLISEVDDSEQLLDNVIKLLQNNELRNTMGENASLWSRQLLWENQVLEYRKLLNES
jgi:phosphatidylinositol alpha-1,6-mannosyltransferase